MHLLHWKLVRKPHDYDKKSLAGGIKYGLPSKIIQLAENRGSGIWDGEFKIYIDCGAFPFCHAFHGVGILPHNRGFSPKLKNPYWSMIFCLSVKSV